MCVCVYIACVLRVDERKGSARACSMWVQQSTMAPAAAAQHCSGKMQRTLRTSAAARAATAAVAAAAVCRITLPLASRPPRIRTALTVAADNPRPLGSLDMVLEAVCSSGCGGRVTPRMETRLF